MLYTAKRMTPVRLLKLTSAVTVVNVIARVIRPQRKKSALRKVPRSVLRLGRATKIVMTGIIIVIVDGMGATAAVPIRGTSFAWTVRVRTHESTVTGLVLCIHSARMATATTRTTTVAAVGMVVTVVGTKIITIFAQIAVVATPTSQGNATASPNVTLRPGKVMGDAMTVTINAVVIGTVATAAPKQTRNCRRHLFFTALIVLASTKRR